MDDDILPQHLLVGEQLAVGIGGSSMYLPNQQTGRRGGWIRYIENDITFSLNQLRVGKDAIVLDDPSKLTTDENKKHGEEKQVNDEVLEDEDTSKKWYGEMLIKSLGWEKLSPSIPENFSIFQDIELHKDHMFDVRYGSPILGCDYVPKSLINELVRDDYMTVVQNNEGKAMEDLLICDPIINDLLVTGHIQTTKDLRHNNDEHTLIAFCSGEANSILKLAVLPENKLCLTQDARWLQELFTKRDDGLWGFTYIDLKARIKSIKIAGVSGLLGRGGDSVGVLTENALYFVRINNIDSQTSRISYLLHEPLKSTSFGDFPFADFAFNPWEFQQIAVIDIRGNWGLARLPKYVGPNSRVRFLSNIRGSIFDPEELSNWKRIEWSSSYSKLLIISASKIVELDFCNDWQLEIVQAKTWSCLRDYRKIDDEFGALLTSKEIIIVSTKSPNQHISRVISWKHCLDPNDQTLRISIQKAPLGIKSLILACIFSKGHNKVYVHGFCHDKDCNLIQSVDGPIAFCVPQVLKGINSMHFLPFNDNEKRITTETEGKKLCFNFCFKDSSTNRLMHCFFTNDEDQAQSFLIPEFASPVPSSFLSSLYLPDVTSIVDQSKMSVITELEHSYPDEEIFQDFGYRLSEAINRYIALWENQEASLTQILVLSSLTNVPTNYESVQELDSFLSQLMGYYTTSDIIFADFKIISRLLIHEESINLDIFFNKLLQCWDFVTSNSQQKTRKVFDDIVWSTLRIHKSGNYGVIESKLRSSLGETYSEILSHWDDDECEITDQMSINTLESNRPRLLSSSQQSQVPTIKSSQRRSIGRERHLRYSQIQSSLSLSPMSTEQRFSPVSDQFNTIPNAMFPAFSLMSSPVRTPSQSQSSQRSRKRKKRICGFG